MSDSHPTPSPDDQQNILGDPLEPCSETPATGYLRDGCCTAVEGDRGQHYLCAEVTEGFLEFSRALGNDLVSPRPEFDFPGLDPGDRWCLCVGRWVEALEAGEAPPVVLAGTNEAALSHPDLDRETLRAHAVDGDD